MTTTANTTPPILFPALEQIARLGRSAVRQGCGIIVKGAPGSGVTTALRAFLEDFGPELAQEGATFLAHAFYGPNSPVRALRRVFGREEATYRKLARVFCLDEAVEHCLRYLRERDVRLLVLDRCDCLEPVCVEVFLRLSAERTAAGHPLGVVLAGRHRGSAASLFPWTTGGASGVALAYDVPKLTREDVFATLVKHWLAGRLDAFEAAVNAAKEGALRLLDEIHDHAEGNCGRLHKFVQAVEMLRPAGGLDEEALREGLRGTFWLR